MHPPLSHLLLRETAIPLTMEAKEIPEEVKELHESSGSVRGLVEKRGQTEDNRIMELEEEATATMVATVVSSMMSFDISGMLMNSWGRLHL